MSWLKVILLYLFLTACSGNGSSKEAGAESVKDKKWACLPKTDKTGFYVGFKKETETTYTYFGTPYPTEKDCEAKINEILNRVESL